MKNALIGILGAILGALLTVLLTPIINEKYENAKLPVASYEVDTPSLNSLPEEARVQISLLNSTITIKHDRGKTATGISAILKFNEAIEKENIVIQEGVETVILNPISKLSYKIDIPKLRKNSAIKIYISHDPKTKIALSDLVIQDGQIRPYSPMYNSSEPSFLEKWAVLLFLGSVFLFIIFAILLVRHFSPKLFSIATNYFGKNPAKAIDPDWLVKALCFALVYNFVLSELLGIVSVFGASLPKIPLFEILIAIAIYVLLIQVPTKLSKK